MGRRGRYHHILAWAIFFSLAKVALAWAQTQSSKPPQDLQLHDIVIPSSVGYVVDTQPGSSSHATSPIIIHIQEAHANYGAQQHIVTILRQLVEEYGLKLILVEGGQGDVGLSYLRHYGTPAHRNEVAEKYLKAGLISAEEYLDIVSDYPLTLWGVEEQGLYDQNVEVFLKTDSLRDALQPALAQVRESAEAITPRVFDPSLLELDERAEAFEQDAVSLSDYAGTLATLAGRAGMELSSFPNLERFLEVRRLEQDIKRPEAQAEQRALMASLSSHLSEPELNALVETATKMKRGEVAPEEFYTHLEQAAATAKMDVPGAYPHLAQYMRYVRESAAVSATALADELSAFVASLRKRLTNTPESQQLATILETLTLMDKLIQFDLSPDEYQTLTSRNLTGLRAQWEPFLNEQRQRAGLAPQSLEALAQFETHWPSFQRFYDVAHSRDEALVTNAVNKLRESGERLAVLITGGFHAPRISALLKSQGVATIVLIPKVTHATDDRLYRAIMRYKSGQGGSFEEVMDLANQTVPATAGEQSAVGREPVAVGSRQ